MIDNDDDDLYRQYRENYKRLMSEIANAFCNSVKFGGRQ